MIAYQPYSLDEIFLESRTSPLPAPAGYRRSRSAQAVDVGPILAETPQLTIAAAIGLVIVMVGAIVYHGRRKEYSAASANIVLFLLAAFVAVGYLVWVPIA
jgi:hypothetical protein